MSENTRKIAKNTLMLYIRTFVTMLVSLFTVRVIFNALGDIDYGIQNVVSGFVLMLSFISGSLSVAISRFFSIELGNKNFDKLRETFASSLSISFIIGIILVILIEIGGILFIKFGMNMPANRVFAANAAFQFSVLTLFVNTISIPYDALIISRERMSAYAYISILDVVLKLLIAFCIFYSKGDRLIVYSALLLIQSIIIRFVYSRFCNRNFPESEFRFSTDKKLLKEIGTMIGWDLWGSSSYVLKNYGVNLLINVYSGVVVNAARGIAMQVNSAVSKFSSGFLTALRPQITMAYVSESKEYLFRLADMGTKFSCYLIIFFAAPLIAECHYILSLWLGEVPEYAVQFTNLIIICTVSEGTLIYCHHAIIMANGNIRNVQLITGIIQLLNLPLSWIILYKGYSPVLTIVIAIIISQITCFIRIIYLHKLIDYNIKHYITSIYFPILMVLVLSITAASLPSLFISDGLDRLFVTGVISIVATTAIVYTIGCDSYERHFINAKIEALVQRFKVHK